MNLKKISKFFRMNNYEKKLSLVRNTYFLTHKYKFNHIGKKSYFIKPIYLAGTQYFTIGDGVGIWFNARVEAIDGCGSEKFSPKLIIGDNTMIGQDCHITLAERVEIEKNVVCSARVTITDISHITIDPLIAVLEQGIVTEPVKICEGAFVGINSTILPGVTIGKHAIIGANSVVTKDIPDYATAVGSPARIIKQK